MSDQRDAQAATVTKGRQAKHFPRGDQRGNSTLSGDYICKRCGGTKPTCCSCPEVRDLDAESARVRQMMKDGDTEGLAAYVNQGNRERAEVAVSRPSVSSEGSPSPAEAQRTTELQAAIDKAIEHEGDRIYDAITGYFDHVGIKYLHPEGEDSADPADWIRHLIDQVRGEQTDRVDELEDQLQRSPAAAQGWQPVESAPKDRPVLVRTADAIAVAEWHEDKYGERFSGWTRPPWPIDDAHPVTSWREIEMPLSPAPPTEDQ